jgi:hypothetical protein
MREHRQHGRDDREGGDEAAEVRAERRRDRRDGDYGDRSARGTKGNIPTRTCMRRRLDAFGSWQQPERETERSARDDEMSTSGELLLML